MKNSDVQLPKNSEERISKLFALVAGCSISGKGAYGSRAMPKTNCGEMAG